MYRQKVGAYRRMEDLAVVSGVSATKLSMLRGEICVGPPRLNSNAGMPNMPNSSIIPSTTHNLFSPINPTLLSPVTNYQVSPLCQANFSNPLCTLAGNSSLTVPFNSSPNMPINVPPNMPPNISLAQPPNQAIESLSWGLQALSLNTPAAVTEQRLGADVASKLMKLEKLASMFSNSQLDLLAEFEPFVLHRCRNRSQLPFSIFPFMYFYIFPSFFMAHLLALSLNCWPSRLV